MASRSIVPTTFTSFSAGCATLKGVDSEDSSICTEISGSTSGVTSLSSSWVSSTSTRVTFGSSTFSVISSWVSLFGCSTFASTGSGCVFFSGFRSIWSTILILFSNLTSSLIEMNSSSSSSVFSFPEEMLPALSIVTVSFFFLVFFRSTREDSFFTWLSDENSFATKA